MVRKIIHSDCDCFYAAIEERDAPALRGRPVAVGGRPHERGVVASCNYPARAAGVRSAMPMSRALRLCPDLEIVRPRMEKYRQASRQILAIYRALTPLVEPLSLDEAYLDVTAVDRYAGSATRMAQALKAQVRAEVGITVSAGVAPNKFLAKVASAWQKPDGLTVIPPAEVDSFLVQLPVEKLYGVGSVTAARLKDHGLSTCGDIRARSRLELRALCGSLGDRLYDLARGVDPRPVEPVQERKSLSIEETYVHDLATLSACQAELELLVGRLVEAADRLKPDEAIEGIYIKIRFDDFRRTTAEKRAQSLDPDQFQALLAVGHARVGRPVRLLGAGARIGKKPPEQLGLFGEAYGEAYGEADPATRVARSA